jgi:integrase
MSNSETTPASAAAAPPASYETKLTKDIVEAARFPESGDYTIRDTDIKGLGLRVSPGNKAWIVRRKMAGKSFRHTLGGFPDMALAEARREAQKALGLFAQGKHPMLEKRARQAETKKQWVDTHFTVGKMWEQYEKQDPANRAKPFSANYLKDCKRLREKIEKDPFWSLQFTELSKSDVYAAYARASKSSDPRATNGGKTTGNKFFRMLGSAAQFHIENNLKADTTNIFQTALKKKRNKPRARSRTLTFEPDSLKRWWAAVKSLRAKANTGDKRMRTSALLADFQILVLLWGGRKSETLALKWEDVDYGKKIVAFTDTKNGEVHLFPLAPLAESVLADIRGLLVEWGIQSDYVFPAMRTGHKSHEKTHIKEPKKAMEAVAAEADVPFATHDIRRTFSNLLVSAEVGAEVQFVKLTLNHSQASDPTTFNYLDKVRTLRPLYEKLERAILIKVSEKVAAKVEIDADEYRKFQEFKALEEQRAAAG